MWQYYRDETVLTDAGTANSFPSNSASFIFKQEMTGKDCTSLLDYTNLLSPNEYEKNDKIILKCFQ